MAERVIIGNQISFADGLALLFIALKLIGKIDWSWWWILAPLWGGILLKAFLESVCDSIKDKRHV